MEDKFVKCEQYSCVYNPECDVIQKHKAKDLLIELCPVCEECHAEPHIINPSCKNCLLCENRLGYIRRGSPKPLLDVMIPVPIKEDDIIIIQERMMNNEKENKI